jgi:DNA-binding XRE family transcriptional regulator
MLNMMDVEDLLKRIQKNIKKIRKEKKLTQEELALLLDISPKSLSDIETFRRKISMKTFLKICILFELDINRLFEEKINNEEK